MSGESKKEEFRKYLERSGVIDALTKVLVALYEEPEKPANALDFIKQYLGAPTSGDVETMKAEKDELMKKCEELEKNLKVLSMCVRLALTSRQLLRACISAPSAPHLLFSIAERLNILFQETQAQLEQKQAAEGGGG
jgi:hypothetical protein